MASLTGNKVSDTYQQLLKLTSQGVGADASAKYIEDGLGTDTALSLSTTRVGIGTASPDSILHIKGGANWRPIFKIENTSTGNESGIIQFHKVASDSSEADNDYLGGIDFYGINDNVNNDSHRFAYMYGISTDVTDGTEDGRIDIMTAKAGTDTITMTITSGNVGIGTTSPDSLLHVKTTANVSETIRIQNDDSLTTIGVSSDGYSFHTYQHSLYYASWDGSSWSTKARFDNDGKFGLGGTSPVGKLDIAQGGYTAGTQAIHFGADSGDNTSRSNNTTKYGVITGDHYSTSEEKIELITYYSNSNSNELLIGGGGNSAYNAPTAISFRIASGYTVTSDNANTIFLVNGGGVTVKQSRTLWSS